MTLKILKDRWIDSGNAKEALENVRKIFKNGGIIKKETSPFGLTEDGLIDLRGIDLRQLQIKKINLQNLDLSYSLFRNSWIEKSNFENVKFEKVDFSEISERGNLFHKVKFSKCKFNNAGIGYEGTRYLNSIFKESNFTKAVFIRGEFVNTQFIDCKLTGVDFYGSSFEECSFVGELKDVWFRGEYAYPIDNERFGTAKKNQMKNVSFVNAHLEGVNFSNRCDLSTVQLPNNSNYMLYNNWKKRLENLENQINEWSISQRKEAELFSKTYLVHAKTQEWFIINIEELKRDFGGEVGLKIIAELSKKS